MRLFHFREVAVRANRIVSLLAAMAAVATSCTSTPDTTTPDPTTPDPTTQGRAANSEVAPGTPLEALPAIGVPARPGPFQLTVDAVPADLSPEAQLELTDEQGRPGSLEAIAENGSVLFRGIEPGPARLFVVEDGERTAEAEALVIPGAAPPPEHDHGAQVLSEGFGYVMTRDGTTLSIHVTLPGSIDQGPYPTLVEYSGYTPSDPNGEDPGRLIVPALGFALVQVNVRGTGCSGGSFDAFERIQAQDGYDVIETVGAQSWVGEVGMYGVSYAGIMQLIVAAAQPPSLRAIAPLSPLGEVETVLYPGGLYNDGFGEAWTQQVNNQATALGQGWSRDRIEAGDIICEANQLLRTHNPDLIDTIRESPFTDALTMERSALTNASKIEVPVFLAGAWQDEQTGSRWPALINEMTNAPIVRAIMYNGLHLDSISGEVLPELAEFYDIYLESPRPGADPMTTLGLSLGYQLIYGESLELGFRRFDPDDLEAIRRDYEAAPPITVLFEQGAPRPNLPVANFRQSFESWPPPAAEEKVFRFVVPEAGEQTDFTLDPGDPHPSAAASTTSFTTDPTEARQTIADSQQQIWTNDPGWLWPKPDTEHHVDATTEALADDLVVVGPASADLWVSANADDADIEVTLSEVHPDGSETYVQAGWLRLSSRTLRPEATTLRPLLTGAEADVAPLIPDGEPILARVELPPFAHVFRPGSRLRITVDSPGASRPSWRFEAADEPATVSIHSGPRQASQLVVSQVADLDVPEARPGCGTLRGQPCRR